MTKLYVNLMGLEELQKFTNSVGSDVVIPVTSTVLDEFSEKAVDECKKEFGVYQPERRGPNQETFPAWQPLKAATIKNKKVRPGQDVPLLDSGNLRDSLQWFSPTNLLRLIGTYDPNGSRHEYGTSRAPARPWLRPVLWALKLDFSIVLRHRLIQEIKKKYAWVSTR